MLLQKQLRAFTTSKNEGVILLWFVIHNFVESLNCEQEK